MEKLKKKHYQRFKNFLIYDLEERSVKEQKIILKEIINVANDLLDELNQN